MTNSTARAAYVSASVTTASPQTLLVMLCERLVLDVQRAVASQQTRDHLQTHQHLVHAQAIVSELRSSLDPDGFRGGHQLAALYDYLLQRLVQANVSKDAVPILECLTLSTQIAQTWREAALLVASSTMEARSA